MDTLKELVKVVNRKRLSKIDVLDKTFLNPSSTNLYYQIYEGIESGKITDDASAANYLYGSEDKDARYRKIKSRFKTKILKSVLLLDSDELFASNQSRSYYECITANQIIEILIKITGTTKLIYELVQDNYSKALKYNFYDILRNYSYYLLTFYALKGDKKSFLIEEENYKKYRVLAQKEQYAKFLYFKAGIEFEHSGPITEELLEKVHSQLNELYNIRLELKNTEIDFYYFFLAIDYFQKNNETHKVLDICEEAENLMLNNPAAFTNTRKIMIAQNKLFALIITRKYENALSVISSDTLQGIPEGNYNWYIFKENEFKLYLRYHKIEEAYRVYNEVLENKSFKRQVDRVIEKWKIFHSYLVFLDNYLNKGEYKFSLNKFLNEVPINSKDKSGYNFAIRVIEMLFQFARKEYTLVFQKIDALRVYRSRYLTDITYKRNHLFLSLLLKGEKSGYNYKTLLNADWAETQELKDHKTVIAEWEILPYEELWDIFIDLAKKD